MSTERLNDEDHAARCQQRADQIEVSTYEDLGRGVKVYICNDCGGWIERPFTDRITG